MMFWYLLHAKMHSECSDQSYLTQNSEVDEGACESLDFLPHLVGQHVFLTLFACWVIYMLLLLAADFFQNTVELRWLELVGTVGASSTHPCVRAIPCLTIFKLVHVYFMSSRTPRFLSIKVAKRT